MFGDSESASWEGNIFLKLMKRKVQMKIVHHELLLPYGRADVELQNNYYQVLKKIENLKNKIGTNLEFRKSTWRNCLLKDLL